MAQEQLIYGIHAVAAALRRGAAQITTLCVVEGNHANSRLQAVIDSAARQGVQLQYNPRAALDGWVPDGVHQGVEGWRRAAAPLDEHDLKDLIAGHDEPAQLLVLDGVQDPHTLGACLRSADAAGAHAV